MKKHTPRVGTYGNTGREYYRLHERAAAQRRATQTITILAVFILAVIVVAGVAR
jgi:hypothetical protein